MSSKMNSKVMLESNAANYARLQGLAIDYLAEPLPFSHIEAVRKGISDNVIDEIQLFNIESAAEVNTKEHLTVDKSAAGLLQGVRNSFSSMEAVDSIIFSLLDARKIKKLRLETPLLLTDHETDFKDFARWEESHYGDGCLPMEPLDDEMDVGLGWPKRLHNLPAEVLQELQAEKLELSKDALLYLRAEIKGRWTEEDEREAWKNVTHYKRSTALEPVTPPLLPTSPPLTPYIHSSSDGHLPLLSDPASLINEDVKKAEETIFDGDKLLAPAGYISPKLNSSNMLDEDNCVNPSDTYSQIMSIGDVGEVLTSCMRAEDRKVEIPLMPPLPMATLSNSVTFSELVEEMLLDGISNNEEEKMPTEGSEGTIDRFFQEAFGEAADRASRAIEQEQLQQADASGRVEVPIMDFRLPNPPWGQLEKLSQSSRLLAAQKSFIAEAREEFGWPPHWPGTNKIVPKLRWTAFALELAKVVLDEAFGEDDILTPFLLPQDESIIDSEGLTWKPPGLRILKNDVYDDEDDLELGSFNAKQPQDVLTLVKKRKMKLLEEKASLIKAETSQRGAPVADMTSDLITTDSQRNNDVIFGKNTTHRAILNVHEGFGPAIKTLESACRKETIFDGPFSAADALDNFLEMRAAKKQKTTSGMYFAGKPTDEGTPATLPSKPSEEVKIAEPSRAMRRPLPVPRITLPSTPTPYIISSAIFKRRNLIRALTRLTPYAIPIERDFTAHNMTAWNVNSVTRSNVASPLDSEADIIISPASGIILTTLQKIKQKPLPGQKSKPAFKQRLEKVSLRYERLVVLVSEGCPDETTNGLAGLDTLALTELIGFCSSLDVTAIVQFVAGGEETLAKWAAAIMAQYSLHGDAAIPLLQDETLWELFLRRAGMNAFAAQAFIAQVKAPEGVEVNSPTKAGMFGITALVEMGPKERMKRFERLLGGNRVLTRVGKVLDGNWS